MCSEKMNKKIEELDKRISNIEQTLIETLNMMAVKEAVKESDNSAKDDVIKTIFLDNDEFEKLSRKTIFRYLAKNEKNSPGNPVMTIGPIETIYVHNGTGVFYNEKSSKLFKVSESTSTDNIYTEVFSSVGIIEDNIDCLRNNKMGFFIDIEEIDDKTRKMFNKLTKGGKINECR